MQRLACSAFEEVLLTAEKKLLRVPHKKMKASKKSKIKGAQFYKVGDKVESVKDDTGAWHTAVIFDISPGPNCECFDECQCTYKILFEGNEDSEEMEVVERKLKEIRQVSYVSIRWEDLKVGMKVVINYNINEPKQWGHWYDYIISNIQKRNDVYFVKGTLLVGYDGSSQKMTVCINSDNVADVLEIRPHATLREKEMDSYETGVKPEYCAKCRNKPKVKCRTCCCCKCGMKKDFELTIQCDECANWYHFYCTKPPIKELPKDDDWYCPKCNNETRRCMLEKKLTLKKKKEVAIGKKSSKKTKPAFRKSSGSTMKTSKGTEIVQNTETPKQEEQDFEGEEITKKLPKNSKVWNQIKELFPEYELVRVRADMIRKKELPGIIISPAAEEFINKDVVNKHLWQEARNHLTEGKQAFLEAVEELFTCAICCELLSDPITLSCSHNFCIDCFFRSLSVDVYSCSLCRVDIIHTQNYVVNENLSGALSLLFDKKE